MAATFLPYDALIWVGLVLIILTCMYTLRACMSACCPAKAGAATPSSLPATSSSSETAGLTDLEAQRSPEAQAPSKDTAWPDVFCAPRLSEPALAVGYLLTIVLVAMILGPDPASFLYEPALESDCSGSCGSKTHCCDYGFFDDAALNATRVSIPSKFGDLDGFLMVNSTAPYAAAPPLHILYSHGSGWNVAVQYRIERYKYLLSQGNVALLTYDYPGYGASPGTVTEDNIMAGAGSALDWLSSNLSVPTSRITLQGRSLGGAVTAALVKRVHGSGAATGGVIVQSSWDFFTTVVGAVFPITTFVPNGIFDGWWPSADNIKPLSSCLFVFGSEDDASVPVSSTKALFDAAVNAPDTPSGCSKFVQVAGPGHDDPMTATEQAAMRAWFAVERLQVAQR